MSPERPHGGTYRQMLALPDARPLLGWSIVARMPLGMAPLALLLLARGEGASYAAAGAVAAAYGVALAIGAPVAGRLVDRRGAYTILLRRAIAYPSLMLGVAALALLDAPLVAIGALAAAAGVGLPPVAPTVRKAWPELVPDELRGAAYGLEAALQEVFFVAGPMVVALLAAAAPTGGVVGAAAFSLVGTTMLVRVRPIRRLAAHAPEHHGLLGALRSPGVRALSVFALLLGLAFGMVEVGFPAFAEAYGSRELGGLALAGFSAGSFVGGLLVGALGTASAQRRFARYAPLIGAGLLLLVAAWSIPTLTLLAFVAGLPIAPAIAAAYGIIDRVSVASTIAESFAWFGTSVAFGAATGIAAGGAIVDHAGVRWTFVAGAIVAFVGAASVLVRRRVLVAAPAR
jgi:MFS family permease